MRTTTVSEDTGFEKHYTCTELAKMWHLSYDVVQRLVRNEPGVLKFDSPALLNKRKKTTIRVPESVAQRVYRRITTH